MNENAAPPAAAPALGETETGPAAATGHQPVPGRLATLALGALGIVYGDLGTSPLYSLRECFHGAHSVPPTEANVLGVLSLVFWTLIVVVTLKYIVYVLRADNRGEGGILALMARVRPLLRGGALQAPLLVLGLFGAALLYGDGAITPAISVLSAIEGLSVATPVFDPYVVPITCVLLVGLFLFQRRGTGGIGAVFGPVMLVWFATLAVLGVLGILRDPGVLAAVNPLHAVRFFARNGVQGFLVLGGVFLVTTGAEALYADMGHFGARPVRLDWLALVAPALLLNYFGQGALLVHEPAASVNPFYHLAPSWALFPLVILASAATVIASQAVISGAFSLTRQAVQLGYLPRLEIVHTSEQAIGQIYIPAVNWALMVATIGLVLGFRVSTNLAGAYGVAVTATMIITTLLAAVVARRQWRWPLPAVVALTAALLLVDLAFFGANLAKIAEGGWFPLTVGLLIYLQMSIWHQGRERVAAQLAQGALPIEQFVASLPPGEPHRVRGTAVFMSRSSEATPAALLHNLKHNQVLHRQVVLLTLQAEEIPQVPRKERIRLEELGNGFYRLVARYGFMEDPNVLDVLAQARRRGLDLDPMRTTFFLSRESLITPKGWHPRHWREKFFALMARNAERPTDFFRIPPNRVVELGMLLRL
jgi:KUP system potassium uptake protein